MKYNFKKNLSLSIISSILLLSGCSSTHEVISSSGVHSYNENFGFIQDYEVDRRVNAEILAQNDPTQIENQFPSHPSWTTELVLDPEAVTAENYVQAPTIFTYKHKFDSEFHQTAEWRSANN